MYDSAIHFIETVASVNADLVFLAVVVIAGLIILNNVSVSAEKKRKQSGITSEHSVVSVDGSKSLALKHYISDLQGLAGRPDALISEEGFIIPIERKPLARKIRDRYVAQLLVYMRLVEEFEGKKPPYGYLILGPSARRFKIENSPDRQTWLQKLLDEMNAVMQGSDAKAAPHERKCSKCDVRDACKHGI